MCIVMIGVISRQHGMDEILKDLALLNNYIWHKSPVNENVSDDIDIKKSAE